MAGCERNPVRAVWSKPVDNARERFLSTEEASRLRTAMAASKTAQLRYMVDWLLYTGCRLREWLDARWENVSVGACNWHGPMPENGRSRIVPTSSAAWAVLDDLPHFEACP